MPKYKRASNMMSRTPKSLKNKTNLSALGLQLSLNGYKSDWLAVALTPTHAKSRSDLEFHSSRNGLTNEPPCWHWPHCCLSSFTLLTLKRKANSTLFEMNYNRCFAQKCENTQSSLEMKFHNILPYINFFYFFYIYLYFFFTFK